MVDPILQSLTRLALHYPRSTRSPEEQAIWLADYAADLSHYDPDKVDEACTRWRRSEAKSFPKSGELLASIRSNLGGGSSQAVLPYVPLSETEYESGSLSDKAEHHAYLATQARYKAGAQWKDGKPCRAEKMSDHWRYWIAIAKNHEADASRYRKLMKDSAHNRLETTPA